jgi:hypothetical protein
MGHHDNEFIGNSELLQKYLQDGAIEDLMAKMPERPFLRDLRHLTHYEQYFEHSRQHIPDQDIADYQAVQYCEKLQQSPDCTHTQAAAFAAIAAADMITKRHVFENLVRNYAESRDTILFDIGINLQLCKIAAQVRGQTDVAKIFERGQSILHGLAGYEFKPDYPDADECKVDLEGAGKLHALDELLISEMPSALDYGTELKRALTILMAVMDRAVQQERQRWLVAQAAQPK